MARPLPVVRLRCALREPTPESEAKTSQTELKLAQKAARPTPQQYIYIEKTIYTYLCAPRKQKNRTALLKPGLAMPCCAHGCPLTYSLRPAVWHDLFKPRFFHGCGCQNPVYTPGEHQNRWYVVVPPHGGGYDSIMANTSILWGPPPPNKCAPHPTGEPLAGGIVGPHLWRAADGPEGKDVAEAAVHVHPVRVAAQLPDLAGGVLQRLRLFKGKHGHEPARSLRLALDMNHPISLHVVTCTVAPREFGPWPCMWASENGAARFGWQSMRNHEETNPFSCMAISDTRTAGKKRGDA